MPLTPRRSYLAKQAGNEMNSGKLMQLITELCDALENEHEENRPSRRGCAEDCREYEQPGGSFEARAPDASRAMKASR
jgi:hypothetical protein